MSFQILNPDMLPAKYTKIHPRIIHCDQMIFSVSFRQSREISTKFRQNIQINRRKDRIAIKSFGKYQQILESFGIINPDKYNIIPKKSFLFPEKIVINPVFRKYFTEKMEFNTGKINSAAGKDNRSAGLIKILTELIKDISEKIPKR